MADKHTKSDACGMKRVEYVGNSENIYDQQKKGRKKRNTLAGDDIDGGTKTYVRVIEKHCSPVKSRFRSFFTIWESKELGHV